MQAKLYTISSRLAATKGITRTFVAAELAKTARGAVYLYGHGETDPEGACCKCGRRLTHPGSILIGIGPECLKSWETRDIVLDNLTPADVAELKSRVRSIPVDGWFLS